VKLLNKYSRVHILTACIVLLVSSIAYYFIIRSIFLKQIDKDLRVEEQEIQDFIKANRSLPHASDYKHQQIRFEILKKSLQFREISNIMEYDERGKGRIPYRRLSFPVNVNGISYKASVYKSLAGSEDLLRLIMMITASVFLVLSALIFIINRFVLGKLWRPFFNTLAALREFDLNTKRHLDLSPTSIEEFEDLNSSVTQMTDRASNDYQTLRAFTDNASHEMQTPLAIIRTKLDLLIQSSHENQVDQLQAIYDATGRLTKLNQTLLLLTKIDNRQFRNPIHVNFRELIDLKIQQFDELMKLKNITHTTRLLDVFVNMNKELADILMNNLLSNAIKHNSEGGHIECLLTSNELSVVNTGSELTFNKEAVFERFQKSNNSDGVGLGLAVVKQICDVSGFKVAYFYNNQRHIFKIDF
jgi:signal transduction histidine kinase